MHNKLKSALDKYRNMGKFKKTVVAALVSIIAIITVFFGGIFISTIVDVVKNPDDFSTTKVDTESIINEISSHIENENQSIISSSSNLDESITSSDGKGNGASSDISASPSKPNIPSTTKAFSNTATARNTTNPTAKATAASTTKTTAKSSAKAELNNVPQFANKPYVVINNNNPGFIESDKKAVSFEKYSPLDSKGRCGVAFACVGKDLMPTGERGSIGSVKPSGWHTVKYAGIDGNYLYNRCHLIGWQLTGENANERNLITGTRYLNIEGMLPFENMVADYIKETNNHVLYRVTPIFKGDNLLASGVQMEAYSVEDNGRGICFNVYCYNAQPGITINYADGSSSGPSMEQNTTKKSVTTKKPSTTKAPANTTKKAVSSNVTYILNTNPSSMKFHKPNCSSVTNMKEENKKEFYGTREEAIAAGYSPCGSCKP